MALGCVLRPSAGSFNRGAGFVLSHSWWSVVQRLPCWRESIASPVGDVPVDTIRYVFGSIASPNSLSPLENGGGSGVAANLSAVAGGGNFGAAGAQARKPWTIDR